jgi:outer membrane protein TolC
MTRTTILVIALTFALVRADSAGAQQNQPANPDSALRIALDELEGSSLTLKDAVAFGLERATSVRAAEAAYVASRGSVRREKGYFDPELFFSLNHYDDERPTASFFAGAPVLNTAETIGSAGVRMELPIGTSLEASLNTVRSETNSAFAFLNPQYDAFGSLSLRQPLLGGFHVTARKEVVRAEEEANAAKARYDQEVLAVSARVEQLYWDLYAVERDYVVQKLIRDRAEAFLKETELRAKTGLIGPNQVASARTFLAEQELLVLDREELMDRVSDELASLVGVRPAEGNRRFIASTEPPDEFPVGDTDEWVRLAIDNSLDLKAGKSEIAARRALSSAAFWEAMPSVDLVGSVGGNGLAGTAQDVVFGSDTLRTTVGGGFNDAASQAMGSEYPSWSVGVEVSIPLFFRTGLGEKQRLDADVTIAEQQYIQQTRSLEERVRATHREIAHGERRLTAAEEGVEAAREQVRIGIIEFQNGRTTAFELVRLAADFAVAEQRYSQALVRSAKAAAELRQLTSGAYPGTSAY